MDLGPGSPSRTSQAVALTRAGMSRPHTGQGDPGAQRRLCEGMTPIRRPRPGIWARTRFFDDQVLAAVRAGVPQVVICGAGYDDRALRFRSPGVRFFELDHPATQADKARRLRAMGADLRSVVLAAADFRDDDAPAVLASAERASGGRLAAAAERDRLAGSLRSRSAGGQRRRGPVATGGGPIRSRADAVGPTA